MSGIQPLTDDNFGLEFNNISNCFGDELAGNSAFIKALEVVILRSIPRLLIPIFEPLVRRIVKEEIELAQQRFSTSTNQNSREREISPQLRKLKLKFRNKLSLPILTGKPILGQDDSPPELELIDENTGLVVKVGPESSAKVEIVVLRVDPKEDERLEWTSKRFDKNIVRENENAKSILTGKTFLNLNEGTGSVDRISFTHGRNWTRKCDFMLGARFVNNYSGITVTEAKTEHFTLEDCRNKLYLKHYPPILTDELWRIENIRKGGRFDQRLNEEKIKTVKDFLIQYFLNRRRLQEILQMPDKVFAATVQHGLTCKRDKYMYSPPNTRQKTYVVFDTVGQLVGVISDNGFVSVDKLPEKAKDDAQISVASAFENWGNVVRYYESESSLPSSSTHLVLPNYPLYSSTLDIPSTYMGPPQHTSALHTHTNSSMCDLNLPEKMVVYDEVRTIICPPMDIMSPNNLSTCTTTTNTSTFDLDFLDTFQPADMELLREYLKSPLHVHEPEGPGFGHDKMLDYTSVVEDFNKEQRAWVRRWLKMVLVVRFFFRMRRMEKTDHVRKRTRTG